MKLALCATMIAGAALTPQTAPQTIAVASPTLHAD